MIDPALIAPLNMTPEQAKEFEALVDDLGLELDEPSR